MKARLFCSLLVIGLMLTPTLVSADPCDTLPPGPAEKYVSLNVSAIEAYGAADFETTISKTLEALVICDEDNNVKYNLARAYHQNGDCPMALFYYDGLDVSSFKRKRKKKINKYKEELMSVCGDSLVVTIDCPNPGATLKFGSRTAICPWVGRLYPDTLDVSVSLDGHRDGSAQIVVAPDQENSFTMPDLVPDSQFGVLAVTCGEGIKSFEMVTPEGQSETLQCPWEGELTIGSYSLKTDPGGKPHLTTVIGEQVTNVNALSTPPPSSCACSMRRSDGGAPVGPFATLLAGLFLLAVRRTS